MVALAVAYVKALDYLDAHSSSPKHPEIRNPNLLIVNLGTGTGYSVLDMVKAFEKGLQAKRSHSAWLPDTLEISLPATQIPSYAKEVLGWEATRRIDEMCTDA